MNFKIENVRSSKNKQEIKALYESLFSKQDRMPFTLMVAMSYLWNTEFLAFYDGVLCGIVYMATVGKQSFIMFFAVEKELHSKGYGSRILGVIQSKYPNNRIILSIEPFDHNASDNEQRMRRKLFYLKNGFFETGYLMKLGSKKQEVLIKNGIFSKTEFITFFMIYSFCTTFPKIEKYNKGAFQ